MALNLCEKYRPRKLGQVIGQDAAVKVLKGYFANGGLPHCLLLTGDPGVGKTSIAKILGNMLGCAGSDYQEINCAERAGTEMIWEIPEFIRLHPTGGARVCYLDEAQALSNKGFAQQSLLKVTEEYPKHAYFIFASTDPSKIKEALRSRCAKIGLRPVPPKVLADHVVDVSAREGKEVTRAVADKLAKSVDGCVRDALVKLEELLLFDTEEEQLEALEESKGQDAVKELFGVLLWDRGKLKWDKVVPVLTKLKGQDPEGIRRAVLRVATNTMLANNDKSARAAKVYSWFKYDIEWTGWDGLVGATWDCVFNGG